MGRMIAVGAACLVLVAGCGSSSKTASSTTSSAPTTTTTVAAKQDIAADKAAGAAANLKLSDVPARWTSSPQTDDDSGSSSQDARMAACMGVAVADIEGSGPTSVDSPDFSDPDGAITISSSVELVASAAEAHTSFTIVSGDKFGSCLSSVLPALLQEGMKDPSSPDGSLPADVKVGPATFTKLPLPHLGDESVAYRLAIPVQGPGITISVTADLVMVRKGRAEITMSFENDGGAPSAADEQHYTQIVVDRIPTTA